jgi:hypothetical protein
MNPFAMGSMRNIPKGADRSKISARRDDAVQTTHMKNHQKLETEMDEHLQ